MVAVAKYADKFIDISGMIPPKEGIEFVGADVAVDITDNKLVAPLCVIWYFLNGAKTKVGFRFDLGKFVILDRDGSFTDEQSVYLNESGIKLAEYVHRLAIGVRPGVYRHYKGNLYEVIGMATGTETREQLVVYRALYGEFQLFVRPFKMFVQDIESQVYSGPRFVPVKLF